jgi:hypothetical protein
VRHWLLGIMLMQGLLPEWQQGTELDSSVYRAAANIPVMVFDSIHTLSLRALERREEFKSKRIVRVVAKAKKATRR